MRATIRVDSPDFEIGFLGFSLRLQQAWPVVHVGRVTCRRYDCQERRDAETDPREVDQKTEEPRQGRGGDCRVKESRGIYEKAA